jgi:hypothetical protein
MDKLPVRHYDGPARGARDVDGPIRRSFARLESNGRPCQKHHTEVMRLRTPNDELQTPNPNGEPCLCFTGFIGQSGRGGRPPLEAAPRDIQHHFTAPTERTPSRESAGNDVHSRSRR